MSTVYTRVNFSNFVYFSNIAYFTCSNFLKLVPFISKIKTSFKIYFKLNSTLHYLEMTLHTLTFKSSAIEQFNKLLEYKTGSNVVIHFCYRYQKKSDEWFSIASNVSNINICFQYLQKKVQYYEEYWNTV